MSPTLREMLTCQQICWHFVDITCFQSLQHSDLFLQNLLVCTVVIECICSYRTYYERMQCMNILAHCLWILQLVNIFVNISINVTKPYNDKIRPEENPCIVGTYTFEKVAQNVAAKSMPSVSTFCQQICWHVNILAKVYKMWEAEREKICDSILIIQFYNK